MWWSAESVGGEMNVERNAVDIAIPVTIGGTEDPMAGYTVQERYEWTEREREEASRAERVESVDCLRYKVSGR